MAGCLTLHPPGRPRTFFERNKWPVGGSFPRGRLVQPMPRPRKPPTVSWSLRVPVSELERWKEAAALELLDASDLVRRAAKHEADRILEAAAAKRPPRKR